MRKSARLLPLALRAASQSTSIQLSELYGSSLCAGLGPRPHFLSASKLHFRTFLSTAADKEVEDDTDEKLREKLRKMAHVVQLQQDLKHESEFHDSIPSERLLQLILDRGAARDETEAKELVAVMQRAGVMLMHNNHVYLKPADLVAHRLPDFLKVEELQAKLAEIDRQLQPFEEVHREAERLSWRLLYFGCFMLALQLAAFLRLTYFELSWDVMEPVGYMISLFYSVLGFVFFIYTRGHPFDLHPVKEWYAKRIKVQRAATFGVEDLDEERYEALVKARDRYSKRLQFLQKLESRRAALATAAVTAAAAAT